MLDIFKSLYIILLLFLALSLHLNSLVFICSTISVIIYITILKKESGQFLLANVRFLFILFLFIYTNSYPFIRLFMRDYIEALNYLPITDVTIEKGMILSNVFIMIYVLFSIWANTFLKNKNTKAEKKYLNMKSYLINFQLNRYIFLFDIFALILCVNYIKTIFNSGLISVIMSGVSRIEAINMIESQPSWIFMYFLVAYSCAVYTTAFNKIRYRNYKSWGMTLRVSILSLFWVTDVLLGNRRLISYIILYIVLYFVLTQKKKISLHKVFSFFLIGLAFMSIGYLRTVGFNFENAKFENVINDSFGEFFIPINTYFYYIEYQIPLLHGSSYFSGLLFLIPRAIWPEKPLSLAVNFANIFGGAMGYGFNPIAEAYINFGELYVVLLPVLLVSLFLVIEKLGYKSYPIYFFVFVQTMNFNRGEFSSTLIEFSIMYLSFLLIAKSQKMTVRKEDQL